MKKNVNMKHSGSNLFLAIIFCISLHLTSAVEGSECPKGLSNADASSTDKSIERSVQLTFEKIKAECNGKEFTKTEDQTDLIRAVKDSDINDKFVYFVLESARQHTFHLPLDEIPLDESGSNLVFVTYINATDSDGMTALMHAAKNGHRMAIIALVRGLALLDWKDKNSRTASMHAAANGHHDIEEMLVKSRRDLLKDLGGPHYGWEGESLDIFLSEIREGPYSSWLTD